LFIITHYGLTCNICDKKYFLENITLKKVLSRGKKGRNFIIMIIVYPLFEILKLKYVIGNFFYLMAKEKSER